MSAHSILSPSGAAGWMHCYAQPCMCKDLEQEESPYAAEGTLAHALAAYCLKTDCDADCDAEGVMAVDVSEDGDEDLRLVPADMYEPVQVYVDTVRNMTLGKVEIGFERTLDTSDVLRVANQKGTADVCAILPCEDTYELQIHDLKYGKGIRVSAELNEQLMIYALAAVNEFEILYDISQVRLVIHQPRLGAVSEWVCPIDELTEFGNQVRAAAARCMALYEGRMDLTDDCFSPGDKTCRWCRAKGFCKALADHVLEGVRGDFSSIKDATSAIPGMENAELTKRLRMVETIKIYTKALESTALSRALSGQVMPGMKIVEGRKGNRSWKDEREAMEMLKGMRLKKNVMFKTVLQTPTEMLKVLKNQPRRLKRLSELIVRRDAVKHLVPLEDDRPAVVIGEVRDDFE